MSPLLACFLSACAILQGYHAEVVAERRWPKVLSRTIVVLESEFTISKLKDRFEALLREEGERLRVLHVEVFVDRREAIHGNSKGGSDVSYERWQYLYQNYENRIPPSAELLLINGNAAMRVRDRAGNIARLVLRGANPYIIHALGRDLYLVHLVEGERASFAPVHKGEDEFTQAVDFFLMTDQGFDMATAKAATEKLRGEIGVGEISVSLRSDPWFIRDENFPVVSPYVSNAKPPTKEEFERAPRISCFAYRETINCW